MASHLKSLSDYKSTGFIDISNKKFGIVLSEYNEQVTEPLFKGVEETLLKEGAKHENIIKKYVPGAYELSYGAQLMAQADNIDAVICLGCVIQGETRHFDFICQAISQGITTVSLKYDKPVIFGVLTPDNLQQAQDRAGGKHGNKGVEAAVAAIKMLSF